MRCSWAPLQLQQLDQPSAQTASHQSNLRGQQALGKLRFIRKTQRHSVCATATGRCKAGAQPASGHTGQLRHPVYFRNPSLEPLGSLSVPTWSADHQCFTASPFFARWSLVSLYSFRVKSKNSGMSRTRPCWARQSDLYMYRLYHVCPKKSVAVSHHFGWNGVPLLGHICSSSEL